jgi:hypothetical protein
MKKIILILVGFSLIGCVSNNDATKLTKKNRGYECEKVRVTGKLIPKTICTTIAQRNEMEEKGKEGLKNRRVAVSSVIMDGSL